MANTSDIYSGTFRNHVTFKMKPFVTVNNGWEQLSIITRSSISEVPRERYNDGFQDSSIFPASEYLFSAPRGLDEFIHFFCSSTFSASEYLFSAPQGLHFVILTNQRYSASSLGTAQISRFETHLEDSTQLNLSTCAASRNFNDLRLSPVPAQLVEISMI